MSYVVRPIKTAFQFNEWSKSWLSLSNLGCSGCASVVFVSVFLVLAYSAGLFLDKSFGTWFPWLAAGSAVAYLLITLVVYSVRKARRNRAEAAKATSDALIIMKGVKEHSEYLTYKARSAGQALKSAAFELEEEAFAPFWDAIENAASSLGECHASCEWLSVGVPRYDEALRGRDHNFPDCFEGIDSLPDCRPLLEDLCRLVRLAQRDFRFANIWEHRQTRKVLIAGFATLGEAIRNLEATVVRSFSELKRTIESLPLQASPASTAKRMALRFVLPFP
jgi:uncharacterized membrane protein